MTKGISILLLLVMQLSFCNNHETKPISSEAQIAFRLADYEKTEGYEERAINGKKIYLNPKTEITERDIDFVIKSIDEHTNTPIINLEMNKTGAEKFATLTANNVSKMLAILVNNEILMAPVIQEKITGGKVQITTGHFNKEEIDKLFNSLTK